MYTIYTDGKALYSPDLANEGYGVISPKMTRELNKVGSLSFILPANNVMYGSIRKLKNIVTVCEDGEEIFRGRVLHDKKDFYNRKNTYCEGELAFLIDSVQRPYTFTGNIAELFTRHIVEHNKLVDAEKQFCVGVITIPDAETSISWSKGEHSDTWTEIKSLVEKYGGHIRTRTVEGKHYVDWLKEDEHICKQTIEFGKNLLDLNEYINAQDIYTVLIPLGANQLTVETVNDGKDYIEDTVASYLFGRIWKHKTWEDITSPAELFKAGNADLQSGIEMAVTLEVAAVDLRHAGVEVERIDVGDYVRVVSVPHGLDKYFLCSKIVYDLENPSKTKYTFGITFHTLTEQQSNDVKSLQSSFIVVQATAKAAETSANNAVKKVEDVIVEVEGKISVVYRYKGSVDNYESLPTEGMEEGDVYNLLDTGANYAWTEDGWDSLAGTIDLSGYVTKEEYQALEERVKTLEGSNV